jgi:FkbM family methyltransferase
MPLLLRIRMAFAGGPLASAVRSVGLAKPLNRWVTLLLFRGRRYKVRIAGRTVRFHVSTFREARRVDDAVGEFDAIRSLCESIRSGDVFYDIGSNIGMFACTVASVHGNDVQVHAFEPEPAVCRRLRENVRLNRLENVTIHEVAIADTCGDAELLVAGGLGFGAHSIVRKSDRDASGAGQKVRVQTQPITEYAEQHRLPAPTIVKCDVEGAEAAVIRSLRPWLENRSIRRFDVEFHPELLREQNETVDELKALVCSFGYDVRAITVRTNTPDLSFTRKAE